MWGSWGKSSSSSSSRPDNDDKKIIYRCSSFKDIENLCLDPNNDNNTNKPTPRRSIFHRVRTANALLRQWPGRSDTRIVVYYTSLRVVRPTFEACRAVQSILQGFQVAIDERDLAMDSGFMTELRELLGHKSSDNLGLPRVFIGGRYIGGAEEVKQLHEIGELKKIIGGLPLGKPGTCVTCGGYRFILCGECSGSRRIFSDKTGFRTCNKCNENGLIRCPRCSSPPPPRPINNTSFSFLINDV